MSSDEKGFLDRWSKRKSIAREEGEEKVAAIEPEVDLSDDADATDEPQMLDETDFEDVDFDDLDKSSDYTRFMKANVPASIQKKALRKLWASDEVFEVLDGMNDYDLDYTGTGLKGAALKTAYEVGRGFLKDDEDEEKDADAIETDDGEKIASADVEGEAPDETETDAQST